MKSSAINQVTIKKSRVLKTFTIEGEIMLELTRFTDRMFKAIREQNSAAPSIARINEFKAIAASIVENLEYIAEQADYKYDKSLLLEVLKLEANEYSEDIE